MFLLSDVSVDGSNRYFITDFYFRKRYHFLVEASIGTWNC